MESVMCLLILLIVFVLLFGVCVDCVVFYVLFEVKEIGIIYEIYVVINCGWCVKDEVFDESWFEIISYLKVVVFVLLSYEVGII